jgi:hypothetical protein
MVNQGIGNYSYLVRGKETVVKFFLTGPTSCTMSSGQSINVTGASLTVSNQGTQIVTGLPSFQSFGNAPAVTATQSSNSPADPVFAVPSTALTPGDGSATFMPTFTARVTYSTTNGKTTTTGLSATLTKTGVTFDKRTNALRVLVVPMGDATAGVLASTQYTPTDQTSTQNGFSALSRIFPVPSGVADLAGAGGIRYVIDDAALVNLKAVTGAYVSVNGTQMFCGTSGNFDAVKAQLAQFMQSWNSLSTNPRVDRVLGVVGSGISIGPDNTSFNCADGMASVVSPEAWVRAIPDQPASSKTAAVPSRTGSLMAMELAHTWGSADESTTFHSPNVAAASNSTAATSGYNVTTRSFLSTNRSAMKYSFTTSPPWNDTLTLLEPTDFSQDRCALGGTVTGLAECAALSTATGTNFGVAAGKPFIVSGTIDVASDPSTADIVQSGFLASQTIGAQTDSQYRYVRRNANDGTLEMNLGFHVSFVNSLHGNGGSANADPSTQEGLFSFALDDNPSLDYATDPAEVQIWKVANTSSSYNPSTAAGDTLMYDRRQQANPPVVNSLSIGAFGAAANFTNTGLIDELHPALTDDGKWIAWDQFNSDPNIDSQGIQVAPSTDYSKAVFVSPVPSDNNGIANPAWNAAGNEIAYDDAGDIYTQTVDLSGPTATFGNPVKVYEATNGEFTFPASHPSWSRDGSSLALEIQTGGDATTGTAVTDIYTIPSTGVSLFDDGTTPITDIGTAHTPSWSHTPGEARIAFMVPCTEICTTIELADPTAPDPTSTPAFLVGGLQPWFGADGRVAYVNSAGNIATIKPDGTGVTQVSTSGQDSAPTTGGGKVGFDRTLPATVVCSELCISGQEDIMLTSVNGQFAVSFTATSTAPLKGELDYLCNGLTYPVQVGLFPDQISGSAQTFNTNFDGSNACGGGTLVARVSDGVQYGASGTGTTTTGTLTVDPKPPTAAIYAPNDQIYGIGPYFGGIAANGTGYDAEGRILPDTGLHWTLKYPDGSVRDLGNFSSSDLPAPAGGWPAGTYTFTLVATDANNVQSAAVTRQVHIGYLFAGGAFLPPLVNPPQVNTASAGAQFPIKWQLKDSNGNFVSDLGSVSSIRYQTDGQPGHCDFATLSGPLVPLPTGGTMLRFDAKNSQFVYNWTTPTSPGCYVFELTLSDGTEHDAWFALS